MNKLAAAIAALALAALPLVANAGADPDCPDYTGDSMVTTADILYVVDRYQEPKGDGTVFSIVELLQTIQHYGESCA